MNCKDEAERDRFHIAIASGLATKVYDVEETITIDGLIVILEGIAILDGESTDHVGPRSLSREQ
jgi:hypothetical protein